MLEKKTIGERVDEAVENVSEKVEGAKEKIANAKKGAGDIANDISNRVKKAVHDSSEVINDLTHKSK